MENKKIIIKDNCVRIKVMILELVITNKINSNLRHMKCNNFRKI